jgi:site-specific DNA-cytosine methylase
MDASPAQNRPLRAIDLFCGAGGSSYGARLAGVEVVAAFDIWEAAVATYSQNFSEVLNIYRDGIYTLRKLGMDRRSYGN